METQPQAKLLRSACIACFDERGRVYLSLRSADRKTYPSHWQTPGGSVEANEEPLEAAVRELWEECGLGVTPSRLVHVSQRIVRCPYAGEYEQHYFMLALRPEEKLETIETDKQGAWRPFDSFDYLHANCMPFLRESIGLAYSAFCNSR